MDPPISTSEDDQQTRQFKEPNTPKSDEPESSFAASPQPTEKLTNVFVTGGMGFIGSHLVYRLLQRPEVRVINIDCGTYAAAGGRRFPESGPEAPFKVRDLNALDRSDLPRHVLLSVRVEDYHTMSLLVRWLDPAIIFHLAAETHVDRAIDEPDVFARTNVLGTQSLLEATRKSGQQIRLVYVSTDEVYGSAQHSAFHEDSRLLPGNSYSASKAAAEHFCLAYHNTYGTDVVITRGANTYGTYQYPEKFLPVVVDNACHDRPVPLYGDGEQQRQWLHVEDHVEAIRCVAEAGTPGRIYNVAGRGPWSNRSLVEKVLDLLRKPRELIQLVPDRPGHDCRYDIDGWRVENELGWRAVKDCDAGIMDTVYWYSSSAGQKWIKNTAHDTQGRLGRTR